MCADFLSLDFETKSTVDLRKSGVYRYAESPTTDIWVCCFAFDDEPVDTWFPGQPLPSRFIEHVEHGGKIRGYNVNFERIIWREIATPRYGWPLPKLTQFHDTAAQVAVLSLPRSLEQASYALRLPVQKDREGHNLMLRLCRPRSYADDGSPIWWSDPEKIEKLAAYCRRDVETERAIANALKPLTEFERHIWLLDAIINDRGAQLDIELIAKARQIVEQSIGHLDRQMKGITKGAVPRCTNVSKLTAWLAGRGVELPTVLKENDDGENEERPTLARAAVRELLERDNLEDDCREAITIREEAAKSSTAKLTAMQNAVCGDNRLRGAFLYHGTGPGRWTGKLVQPANLPRGTVANVNNSVDTVLLGDADALDIVWGSPLAVISSLLRGCFIAAPGKRLIVVDYAAIQARITAWISGEDWKIQAFRDFDAKTGPDLYKLAASRIYKKPVKEIDKQERQIGKVSELACSFGGGLNAFQTMAAVYGVKIPNEEADFAKQAWREANPAHTHTWRELNDACFEAVRRIGVVTSACRGRIKFKRTDSFLYMRLPSGRCIAYAYPSIGMRTMPWKDENGNPIEQEGVLFWAVDSLTKQWTQHSTYGGKLLENIAMGIERDILVRAMLRLEKAGYPITLHNYDEIVAEVPIGFGSVTEAEALMVRGEEWTAGLPIAAEGFECVRYKKG